MREENGDVLGVGARGGQEDSDVLVELVEFRKSFSYFLHYNFDAEIATLKFLIILLSSIIRNLSG